MEIERKFLVQTVPGDLAQYVCRRIEQGYLCTDPVVRIRRQDNEYYLTYKGSGLMSREEYNLLLSESAYQHLKPKTDGNLISKKRYIIPIENHLNIELDIFEPPFAPLIIAEVEFPDEESAQTFLPPAWFGREVTFDGRYHNSSLSAMKF